MICKLFVYFVVKCVDVKLKLCNDQEPEQSEPRIHFKTHLKKKMTTSFDTKRMYRIKLSKQLFS